jgi:hypothetical protein
MRLDQVRRGAINSRVPKLGQGTTGDRHESNTFESQHAEIIGRTLRWADEAAARQDYVEALRWVETVQGLGEALPGQYEAKRRVWRRLASAAG